MNDIIKVNTKELLNALKKVVKNNDKKYKWYDCVTLERETESNSQLKISNIDLDLGINISIDSYGYEGLLMDCDSVSKIINGLKYFDGETSIYINNEDSKVMFSDDKKVIAANIVAPTDTINININAKEKEFATTEIDFDLTGILKKHIAFVSKNDARPLLTGVSINGNKIVATDSWKMSYSYIKTALPEMVISSQCIKALCDNKENITSVAISDNNMYVKFDCGNVTYLSKLINGNYPNTDRIVPQDFNKEIIFKTDELLSNSNFIKAICNKNETPLLNIVDNEIYASSLENSNNAGECKTEADLKNIKIALNCNFLLVALKQIDTDNVKLKYVSGVAPLVIDDNTETNYLILPVRTK